MATKKSKKSKNDERVAEIKKMSEQELIDALYAALIWCSGSSDFGTGGFARKGWLKVCRPLIVAMPEVSSYPLAGDPSGDGF